MNGNTVPLGLKVQGWIQTPPAIDPGSSMLGEISGLQDEETGKDVLLMKVPYVHGKTVSTL